ncbi:MAG: septum formation inhibitor Maf [Frankiales bacterium]|nr:septum formation inhibitor Maf [Frankiales bacterium]
MLASVSPARRRLLEDAGFAPEVLVSGVNEDDVRGTARYMTNELATRKARAVAADQPDAIVIGCDSLLDLDGRAMGKPISVEDATARWHTMRGRTGRLLTGHCVIADGREAAEVCVTSVRFGRPTDAEIDAYVATGEPLAVAGAFTLDGRSAPFIEGIDGDPGNVIGLSLPLLRTLLGRLGVSVVDLWR